MTRHDPERSRFTAALELLTENGFEGMATAIELLLNEAMKLERSESSAPARTSGPRSVTGTRTATRASA